MTAYRPSPRINSRVVAPVLEALELKAGYQRRQVLYDVSLNVGSGEIVAVLGHNGAGKTTLLKAIIGFIPLFGGQIWLNGKDRTSENYGEGSCRDVLYLGRSSHLSRSHCARQPRAGVASPLLTHRRGPPHAGSSPSSRSWKSGRVSLVERSAAGSSGCSPLGMAIMAGRS